MKALLGRSEIRKSLNSSHHGLTEDDAALIRRHQVISIPLLGYFTNIVGVRTDVRLFRGYEPGSGNVESISEGVSRLIELVGTLRAVDSMRSNRFVVAEIGAGWGPWMLTGAVAARSHGATDIHMIAVEADPKHFPKLARHVADNGFDPQKQRLLQAIVAQDDGHAFFPSDQSREDWGGAALYAETLEPRVTKDYRGVELHHKKLRAISLSTALCERNEIDLVHLDIQGAENLIVRSSIDVLTQKVRWLVVSTHSRIIEGELINSLSGAGWTLFNEKPCRFTPSRRPVKAFDKLTDEDGAQVWKNPRFA
jgi:FkbM family methyltransferase